jgi:hypothetical protein
MALQRGYMILIAVLMTFALMAYAAVNKNESPDPPVPYFCKE